MRKLVNVFIDPQPDFCKFPEELSSLEVLSLDHHPGSVKDTVADLQARFERSRTLTVVELPEWLPHCVIGTKTP
jgi:hypothetical protein